ncbi:hypothetical protein CKA55_13460, partial [Arcobacter suis]|uniref:hypothetical protein n=1 Tax=Arcobacter suis TaxID=1278212 RepID=UPI00100601A9
NDITATEESDKGLLDNQVVEDGPLTVQDSTDTTTVTVGTAPVNEEATTAIVKVTLAGHIFKTGETVTVTLADGTEVESTQNGSKDATFTFTADSDSIIEADTTKDITATVVRDKGIIEKPVVNAGTLTVQDSTHTKKVQVCTSTVK